MKQAEITVEESDGGRKSIMITLPTSLGDFKMSISNTSHISFSYRCLNCKDCKIHSIFTGKLNLSQVENVLIPFLLNLINSKKKI